MKNVRGFGRLALMSALVVAMAALGQEVLPGLGETAAPRIIVIMDTSRSMTEPPDGGVPAPSPNNGTTDSQGGDYDCTAGGNPQCVSKFCSAKEVLCGVLPQFQEIQFALGGYYQYVANAHRDESRTSQCVYDVLEPPGLTRTFSSGTDLTGGGASLTTASVDLGAAGILSGCASGAGSTYPVTKTSATPTGVLTPSSCYPMNSTGLTNTFAFPFGANGYLSGTMPTGCNTTTNYQLPTSRVVTPNIYYLMAYTASDAGCPGATAPTGSSTGNLAAGTARSVRLTGNPTMCTTNAATYGNATNCYSYTDAVTGLPLFTSGTAVGGGPPVGGYPLGPAINGNHCTTGLPCDLFLVSKTDVGGRAWYGFWDPTAFTPDAGYSSGGLSYGSATPLGATQLLTGAATACTITGSSKTYTFTTVGDKLAVDDGTALSAFSLPSGNNARNAVETSVAIGLAVSPPAAGGRMNNTPTATGNTYNCTAPWRCDVTLASTGVTNGTNTTTYSNTASTCAANCATAGAGGCAWTGSGSTGPYYTTRPGASCASPVTATSATIAAPQGSWITGSNFTVTTNGPPTDCSTGDMACTLTGTSTNLTPNCGTQTVWNGNTTFTCAVNGNSWTAGGTGTNTSLSSVSYDTVANGVGPHSCTASASIYGGNNSGIDAGTACTGATSAQPCLVTNTNPGNSVTGTMETVTYNTASSSPSGSSWAQTGAAPVGGTVSNSSCPTVSSSCNVSVSCPSVGSDGNYLGNGNTYRSLGPVQYASTGCGTEGDKPCMQCGYQLMQYTWQRYRFACTYSATWHSFTPATVPACSYNRATYTKTACNKTCTYSTTARRYDFNTPSRSMCTYTAVGEQLQIAPGYTYTYQYATKGGELYGKYTQDLGSSPVCDGTYHYTDGGTLATACPPLVTDCVAPATRGTADAGFTCKLSNSSTVGEGAPNRYTNFSGGSSLGALTTSGTSAALKYWSGPEANGSASRSECLMSEASLATVDTASGLDAKRAAFCLGGGTSSDDQYKLISDWYDPGATTPSTLASLTSGSPPIFPPSYTVTWTRPTASDPKSFGLSLAVDGGASTPSMIFVKIDPNANDSSGEQAAIRSALRPCKRPSIANGNVTPGVAGWDTSTSGFCYSEVGDPTTPTGVSYSNLTDYTPMYGALHTAADYVRQLVAADMSYQCRGYYLLLATDGEENPKTINGLNMENQLAPLVASFRSLTGGGNTVDLKTFVVGFGSAATGTGNMAILDAMATAGGTGRAYPATNATALADALRAIFSGITAGVFSRSKPTIATDGSRLYASYFTAQKTGEWAGELNAYKINADGSLSIMWAASPKVNAQTSSSRILRVALDGTSSRAFDTTSLGSGAGTLGGLISSGGTYPVGLAPSTVVDFIRNDSLTQPMDSVLLPTPTRSTRLGGLVHSNPVVVGTSPYDPSWGGTGAAQAEFVNYVNATKLRGTRVVLGSMDGFLRGFREYSGDPACGLIGTDGGLPTDFAAACPNGQEAWGFMPSQVVPNLHKLRKGFTGQLGVDGTVAVSDVCAAPGGAATCAQSAWRSVAIGGEREGGREVFALDITGASDAGIGPAPGYLWGFTHNDLGFSYSTPGIGRIQDGTGDRFVAIFGAGKDDPGTLGNEGTAIFVVDAIDGGLVAEFDEFSRVVRHRRSGHNTVDDFPFNDSDYKYARPAVYRYPGEPHLFAAYIPGTSGAMYAMRFMNGASTIIDPDSWEPEELWNPVATRSRWRAQGGTDSTPFTRVVPDPANDGGIPTFVLVDPTTTPDFPGTYSGTLPFPAAQVRPLVNRPKAVAVLDTTGHLPDLFFGTGDSINPGNPGTPPVELPTGYTTNPLTSLANWNYFVALHDNGSGTPSNASGLTIWGHYFINSSEQVVSEPAVINGGVIVATYTPSETRTMVDGGWNCATVGDTTLYCFNPVDGSLTDCLVYTSGQFAGRRTSVIHMGAVGIPSDMVVINNHMYFATSSGGVTTQDIRQTPPSGDVRSYRRLR